MEINSYLQRIRKWNPDLDLGQTRVDPYGLNNLVIIVGERWVFRFPRNIESKSSLIHETKILSVVKKYVNISVPEFEFTEDLELGIYPLLVGNPLYRHDFLRLSDNLKENFAADLAGFLKDLHAIPLDELDKSVVSPEPHETESRQYWSERLDELRAELFRYLWADQHAYIEDLFSPVLDGRLDMSRYSPSLIHNDLASYHLLVDLSSGRLTGVLDFGEASIGDPASDYGTLINSYGETMVGLMARQNPAINDLIDRARFRAAYLELEWALKGVRTDDPQWFLVHLGRARDSQPVGT